MPTVIASTRYAGKSFDTTRTYLGRGERLRPSTSSCTQRHQMNAANAPNTHHGKAYSRFRSPLDASGPGRWAAVTGSRPAMPVDDGVLVGNGRSVATTYPP